MKNRQEIVEAKARLNRIIKTKKAMKQINAGLVLMAAGAVLNHVSANDTVVVQAQTSNRMTQSGFLGLITDYATKIAAENDLYASVMIAQAALESGWGNSTLSQAPNYNLFGIKGEYNGNTVVKNTLEDNGSGDYYQIQDGFRKYDNYGQSLTDYASLLTGDNDSNNWRYSFYSGARYSNTESYQDATKYLTGRYATDTRYADKLNRIITENNLAQFDVSRTGAPVEAPADEKDTTTPNEDTGTAAGTYKVQAGDGFWGIARRFGTTVEALKSVNGTTSNLIHPGQVIKLPGNSVVEQPNSDDSTNGTTPNDTATGTYTIKRGDGLYGIASKHGMTLSQLKSLNGLTSDLIHPGQTLNVTGSTENTGNNEPINDGSTNNNSGATAGTYSVKAGDGLYRIAANNGMSVNELKSLNGLSSNLIHPGQVLKVSSTSNTEVGNTDSSESNMPTDNNSNAETTAGSYSVKAGEGLYRIAANHGMTINELKTLNGLTSNLIHPGQVLNVSGSTSTTQSPVETTEVAAPIEVVEVVEEVAEKEVTENEVVATTPVVEDTVSSYTVIAGDTLYSIAARNGLDVYQLIEKNNDSSNIYVGQTIGLN